jgi:hypothetical protein
MISELNDSEILDFLMTSDFEENYKPEEFRYLLYKFRYFYRILHGKNEIQNSDTDSKIKKLNEFIENQENQINILKYENSQKEDLIGSMKLRKLTFKERITGKIITEDEN